MPWLLRHGAARHPARQSRHETTKVALTSYPAPRLAVVARRPSVLGLALGLRLLHARMQIRPVTTTGAGAGAGGLTIAADNNALATGVDLGTVRSNSARRSRCVMKGGPWALAASAQPNRPAAPLRCQWPRAPVSRTARHLEPAAGSLATASGAAAGAPRQRS